jgi:hypothetical protein
MKKRGLTHNGGEDEDADQVADNGEDVPATGASN